MNNLIGKASAAVKKVGAMRESMVHNIWLAGLGAYAKSAEEVSELSARSQSLFEELIARGKELEKSTKEKVADAASDATHALEHKVNGLVQKAAGLDSAQLRAMDKKIDQLTKQVEKLLAEQNKPAAKKAPARKAPAKAAVARKPVAKAPTKPASKAVVARPAAKTEVTAPAPVTEPAAPKPAVINRPAAKKPDEVTTE